MNPAILEATDDLTNLSYLNEPAGEQWPLGIEEGTPRRPNDAAVLHAIRLRYNNHKEIYTYSGIVLIATNPFARVDSLYVPGMVQVYAGKQRSTQAPHLFAIAEEAFAYAIPATQDGSTLMDRLTSGLSGTCFVMARTRPSSCQENPEPVRRSAPSTS